MLRWSLFLAVVLPGSLLWADERSEDDVLESFRANMAGPSLVFSAPQADRRIAFRNIEKILPTRPIPAGENPYSLGSKPVSLKNPYSLRSQPLSLQDISYAVAGVSHRLADFLANDGLIGMVVVKDDHVLFEHYPDDIEESDVWVSFSVTKSVTSMLIGAAIQDGYIESVDEPVVDYLPRLRGTSYEYATIGNLLNMASGVRWNEDYADPESDVARAGDANGLNLARYLGTLPLDANPGDRFNYNTGETNLVGEVLRAAIGNNAATYLIHKIWQPFGMEHDANWLLGAPGGGELGGCCISASLRDYARLGIFAMNGGRLKDGTRVLPEDWMSVSTTPSKGYAGYGYLWWLPGDGSYSANGVFGQRIHIFPEDNLVIAMHGNAETAVGTEYHVHQRAVLQAVRDFMVRFG